MSFTLSGGINIPCPSVQKKYLVPEINPLCSPSRKGY